MATDVICAFMKWGYTRNALVNQLARARFASAVTTVIIREAQNQGRIATCTLIDEVSAARQTGGMTTVIFQAENQRTVARKTLTFKLP